MSKGGSYRVVDGKKSRLNRETGEWELIESGNEETTPKKAKTPKKTPKKDD